MSKQRVPSKVLLSWFERQKRVLPWRDNPSLYRVWISEIMLQQTQVATVVPYFERFLSALPSVEKLAQASVEEVLRLWAGLGYYSRARNLHRAAQQIVARGGFPRDRGGWLELPGVGDYTAGAILSIALDQPEAILDGNVERVLSRVARIDRGQGDAAFKDALWKLSEAWVREAHERDGRPSQFNQALMELGATVCSPKKPRCLLCPLSEDCQARRHGDPEAFPPKKAPKKWIRVQEELHCILDSENRAWLRLRLPGEWRSGLWDFPEAQDFSRAKELGLIESKHVVTRHKVERTIHVWRLSGIGASESEDPTRKWVSVFKPEVPLGSPARKALAEIASRFRLLP